MKKKIKDLTHDEIDSICDSYDCGECTKCPFYTPLSELCKCCEIYKYGEEEIEVDLDE